MEMARSNGFHRQVQEVFREAAGEGGKAITLTAKNTMLAKPGVMAREILSTQKLYEDALPYRTWIEGFKNLIEPYARQHAKLHRTELTRDLMEQANILVGMYVQRAVEGNKDILADDSKPEKEDG